MFFFASPVLQVLFGPWMEGSLATAYVAGAILVGGAWCPAMVFVWSYLARGDRAYTLVQVAVNNLVMLFAFAPIVAFLLGVSNVIVPWDTLLLSVLLYIVIPLTAGYAVRLAVIERKGAVWFDTVFLPRFGPVTMVALLLTLVLLFSFCAEMIVGRPLHIALISVPPPVRRFFIL